MQVFRFLLHEQLAFTTAKHAHAEHNWVQMRTMHRVYPHLMTALLSVKGSDVSIKQ